MGHKRIISRVVDLAENIQGTSIVLTFSNHPNSIIKPHRCPKYISREDEKVQLIKELHVDILMNMNIQFTHHFSRISPKGFIELLHDNLQPEVVVVGPNFSFGYKGDGTTKMLIEYGKIYEFQTEILGAVQIKNTVVSSTLIRKLIEEGNYEKAESFLGRTLHPETKTAVYAL